MHLKKIKKYLPTRTDVQEKKYLRFLGEHLHGSNLWHFNRRSVSRATAIGLFCAFLPMPFEMIPAAVGAILWRANLPLAIAWVWLSNPLTWVPLYGPPYLLGAWLLNRPTVPLDELTIDVLAGHVVALWLGCMLMGAVVGALGYVVVNAIWRSRVVNSWQKRRQRRKLRKNRNKPET